MDAVYRLSTWCVRMSSSLLCPDLLPECGLLMQMFGPRYVREDADHLTVHVVYLALICHTADKAVGCCWDYLAGPNIIPMTLTDIHGHTEEQSSFSTSVLPMAMQVLGVTFEPVHALSTSGIV